MIDIINKLIAAIGSAINGLLSVLPPSPFVYVYNLDTGWLNSINYFLPIKEFVACLESYVAAVIVYYGIRIVLRWIKVVGD